VNDSRHHTDQADSRETLDSLEEKLAQTPRRSSIQLTSAEARARALTAANTNRSRCTDCPCDGMGAVAAVVLMGIGGLVTWFITYTCMGGFS
jgi:hypothetical protein